MPRAGSRSSSAAGRPSFFNAVRISIWSTTGRCAARAAGTCSSRRPSPIPTTVRFWFADTVRVEGGERDLSFYNGLTSGVKAESGDYGPPFRDRIRLVSFPRLEAAKARADIDARLVWESDGGPSSTKRAGLKSIASVTANTFSI